MKYYIEESNRRSRWSVIHKATQDNILQRLLLKLYKSMPELRQEFIVSLEQELNTLFDIFTSAGYDMYIYKFTEPILMRIDYEYLTAV